MSDANSPAIKQRTTPQWSLYQRENFWKPNTGEVPPFNTGRPLYLPPTTVFLLNQLTHHVLEPGKLEELAKEKLTQGGWHVVWELSIIWTSDA